MFIKAGGLITVADGTGPTFDQGTALRFLGEIIWFPSAALTRHITWQPIDERRANGLDQFLEMFGKPPRLLTTDAERRVLLNPIDPL